MIIYYKQDLVNKLIIDNELDSHSTITALLHLQDVFLCRNWLVGVPISFVKFVLELHPVQTQRVEEALHSVHAHQHSECHPDQDVKHYRHLGYY
jgi:hypothetical protein